MPSLRQRPRAGQAVGVASALGVTVLVALLARHRDPAGSVLTATDDPTPTVWVYYQQPTATLVPQPVSTTEPTLSSAEIAPWNRGPIVSGSEAITRSLEMLGEGKSPYDVIVRHITYGILEPWRAALPPDPEVADDLVWVVGMRTNNAHLRDIIPLALFGIDESSEQLTAEEQTKRNNGNPAIYGAYFVFDGATGMVMGQGELFPTGDEFSYNGLESMPVAPQ